MYLTAFSSPLSEVPDLPTELLDPVEEKIESENEIIAHPKRTTKSKPRPEPKTTTTTAGNTKRGYSPRFDESEAESSTTAAKRAKMAGSNSVRNGDTSSTPRKQKQKQKAKEWEEGMSNIVTGKRARKQIQELDFADPDEMDEDGQRPVVKSKTGGAQGRSKGDSRRMRDGWPC